MNRQGIDFGSSSFDRIVEVIGEDGAKALVNVFGGQSLHIPVKIRDECRIKKVIGEDAMRLLSAALGGQHFLIRITYPAKNPMAVVRGDPNVSPQTRNREIAAARRAGAKIANLVREFGVTERTIYKVLRDYGLTKSVKSLVAIDS